jgi:soluble cytochrome b562
MWRETNTTKDYFNLGTDQKDGKVKFALYNKETKQNVYFNSLNGIVTGIKQKQKTITPQKWANAGKEITIEEIAIDMVDENGNMTVSFNLYGWMWRQVLNSFAGHFISWGNNENIKLWLWTSNGFTNLYITDETVEWDYQSKKLKWIVNMDKINELKKTVMVNSKETTDYTELTKVLVWYIDEINKSIQKLDHTCIDTKKPVEKELVEADENFIPF